MAAHHITVRSSIQLACYRRRESTDDCGLLVLAWQTVTVNRSLREFLRRTLADVESKERDA